MYTVFLKKNEEKNVLGGYPWIYANEVQKIEGKDKQGSVCEVRSSDGRFVGYGFINHQSKLIVRMLTLKSETVDEEFFKNRIIKANNYRTELGYEDNYRVVFSESDGLPGLIVDKYGKALSVQFLCLGMEVRKQLIIDILVEIFNPTLIYERSDVPIRRKEGLEPKKGVLYGDGDTTVEIVENGIKMLVDLENGQKTGYFLDQKENRDNLKHYVKGKKVLDLFCNEGGFALNAKKHGASDVTAVDISQKAIDLVEKNAKLNGFELNCVCDDVFKFLSEKRENGETYDLIVLDPPAFTKTVDTVKEGYRGYKDVNKKALKLVKKGGYLVTCSCSQHMTINLFTQMLREATKECGINARLVELRIQAKDHATAISYDECLYLKVAILRID